MSASLQVLVAAVAQRLPAIIHTGGRRADDALQICFLADGRPSGDEGIWAELVRGELGLIDRLISSRHHIDVSFTSGHSVVHFETLLLLRQRRFLRSERILMSWPAQVRVTERRRAERERVPNEVEVTGQLKTEQWQCEWPLPVWDLSETGACLLWPAGKRPPSLEPGDAMELSLRIWGVDYQLSAYFRRSQVMPDGRVKLGIEFATDKVGVPDALPNLIDDLKTRRIRNSLGSTLGGRSVA